MSPPCSTSNCTICAQIISSVRGTTRSRTRRRVDVDTDVDIDMNSSPSYSVWGSLFSAGLGVGPVHNATLFSLCASCNTRLMEVVGLREQVTRLEEEVAKKAGALRALVGAAGGTGMWMNFDPAATRLREELVSMGGGGDLYNNQQPPVTGEVDNFLFALVQQEHPQPHPTMLLRSSSSNSHPQHQQQQHIHDLGKGQNPVSLNPCLPPQPQPEPELQDKQPEPDQLDVDNMNIDPDFDPELETGSEEDKETDPPIPDLDQDAPPHSKSKSKHKKDGDGRFGKMSETRRLKMLSKRHSASVETLGKVVTTEDGKRFYDSHEILTLPSGTLQCGSCGWRESNDGTRNWLRIRSMKIHIKGLHLNAYKCDTCSTNFTSHKQLRDHSCGRVRTRKRRTFQCAGCQKDFMFQNSLTSHRKNCEAVASGATKNAPSSCAKKVCTICGRSVSAYHLKSHLWTHMNAEERAVATAAGQVPAQITMNKAQEQCPTCGKMISKAYFAHHLDLHKEPGELELEKLLTCPVEGCGATFPNTKFLANHKKQKHPKPRQPAKCPDPDCDGRTFLSRKNLMTHTRRRHGGSNYETFSCPICNTKKYFQSDLANHVRFHKSRGQTAEMYKVPCTVEGCGQKCRTKYTLKTHEAWAHPELKPKNKTIATGDDNAYPLPFPLPPSRKQIAELKRKLREASAKPKSTRVTEELPPFAKLEDGGGWQLEFLGFTVFQGIDGYTCETCGKEFNFDLDPLADHEEKEDKLKREQVARDVKRHIKAVHRKDYKCDQCGKVMGSHTNLMTHRRHHLNKIQVQCPICEGPFLPSEMEVHQWTHRSVAEYVSAINSGEKIPILILGNPSHPIVYLEQDEVPIKCDHCGGEELSPAHLFRHIVKKHPEIYPKRKGRMARGRKKVVEADVEAEVASDNQCSDNLHFSFSEGELEIKYESDLSNL